MKLVLELLKVTHATSAGLKAFCTYDDGHRSRYLTVSNSRGPAHFAMALAITPGGARSSSLSRRARRWAGMATRRTPASRRCTKILPCSAPGRYARIE